MDHEIYDVFQSLDSSIDFEKCHESDHDPMNDDASNHDDVLPKIATADKAVTTLAKHSSRAIARVGGQPWSDVSGCVADGHNLRRCGCRCCWADPICDPTRLESFSCPSAPTTACPVRFRRRCSSEPVPLICITDHRIP